MIVGVGFDLVDVPGFREQLSDRASSFVSGTFTEAEQRASQGRASGDPARHLAARFAAKEAFIKAWSGSRYDETPHLSHLDMREIEVESDRFGRPRLILHGSVARAVSLDGAYRTHLSLTHDGPLAGAHVILERS